MGKLTEEDIDAIVHTAASVATIYLHLGVVHEGASLLAEALRSANKRAAELERALENVRMLVATRKKRFDPEMAGHLLRFCREAGIEGSVLRDAEPKDPTDG
jgi:hypothetical protein